jgi:flagellar biogenesis protein FliO
VGPIFVRPSAGATLTNLPIEAGVLGRAVSALAGVLALLGASLWLLRHHAGAAWQRAKPGGRLAVTASLALDARVRLVLIRRDSVEHLLAIGPSGVQLLESVRTLQEHVVSGDGST